MRRKSSLRLVAAVVGVLVIINAGSSVVARFHWNSTGETGARLYVARKAEAGEVMNYLVAGSYQQPTGAFDHWLTPKLKGGITYVMYSSYGCNMKHIAHQVINDIREHDYKARIFGVSIGDYVCRRAEAELENVETFAINPEPEPAILRPWARAASIGGGVLLEALSVFTGYASVVPNPIMKTASGNVSLAYFADQLLNIGLIKPAPHAISKTKAVFLSGYSETESLDQFLQNQKILEYFAGVPVFWVHSDHGNSVDQADGYIEAWAEYEAYEAAKTENGTP